MMKMLSRREDTSPEQKSLAHKSYIPRRIIGIQGDIEIFVIM